MTIVKESVAYRAHRYIRVTARWQRWLRAHAWTQTYRNTFNSLTLALEILLQITGDHLPIAPTTAAAERALLSLLGAIHSTKFVQREGSTLGVWGRALLGAVNKVRAASGKGPLPYGIGLETADEIKQLATEFESMPLNDEALWVWSAWTVNNKKGSVQHLPLFPFYEAFGLKFTERLYSVCDDFFSASAYPAVPEMSYFADFIRSRPDIDNAFLKRPHAGEGLWHDFYSYFKSHYRGKNETMLAHWNGFSGFARKHLIQSGLFPETLSRFPGPDDDRPKVFSDTIIKVSGKGNKRDKLLFDLPKGNNGTEIWSYLETSCPLVLSRVRLWAESRVADSWARHIRRKHRARFTASSGDFCVKPGKKARQKGPDRHMYAARTYESEGHFCDRGEKRKLASAKYPIPIREAVHELGLPVYGALLPFGALLVLEHPIITTTFLEELELWDDDDNLKNLTKQNGFWYLTGVKERAGVRLGEQRVPLSQKTLRIVWKIISITKPLREWLRKNGDPLAKRLFLECGKGFSVPKSVKFSKIAYDSGNRDKCVAQLLNQDEDIGKSDADFLFQRFSLTTLRKTVGVSIFVETRNPYIASRALGHDEYEPSLFTRYVPPQINALAFELVIRNLQTSMVAEASKDSAHKTYITGFRTNEELRKFLEANAFPEIGTLSGAIREENRRIIERAKKSSEIVFSISMETLIPITSAADALRQVPLTLSPAGAKLASFARAIVDMLDARRGLEPTVDMLVAEAKSQIDIDLVREALCG
ncbi:hypothetical protein [Burkholderia lata]|uniref:hypothetical protein n=1 Tax=Burkholderia lata (strain ATCC 17760 / DSM 23089 / LMG 22485 / NCIMB 9086 / R18194 / 383) TaxID=482957 RepID=UPI0014533655|nr:hypothetical protein [Burkholderia lata]VWB31512.1 hypothetical protein BLA15816_01361 [Burkholderia lata]